MDKLLARSGLLDGIDEKDLTHLFGCTGGRERSFSAGEPICEEGGRPSVCVLLAGCAASVPDGMSRVFEPGDVFLCDGASIYARAPSRALVFREDRFRCVCGASCAYHRRLVENLASLI